MEKSLGHKIRRNARASVVAWAVHQGSKFFLVPIIIHFINYDGYALISFAFIMMTYFTLQNFGITNAFVNYTADCYVTRDFNRLNRLLSTGMAVCLILAVVTLAAIWGFTDLIIRYFAIDASRIEDARYVVRCIGVISAATIVFGLYRAALTGIQRIDRITMTHMAFSVFEFVSIAFILYLGRGVRAVMTVYTASQLGFLFFVALQTKWLMPELRVNPFRAERASIRPIVSLGGRMQLLGITAVVLSTMDGLAVTKYEGLAFAGVYLVARRLLQRLQALPAQGFGPLMPASADLHSREDFQKLSQVFSSAMRILAVGSAFMFAFIAVNGDLVVKGYIGPDKSDPRTIFVLGFLCVSTFLHILTGPGSSMLRGAGKPFLEMAYQILAIPIYFALFNIAQRMQNEHLILLSFPIALSFASFVFIMLSNRYFKAPLLCPFSSTMALLVAAPLLAWLIRRGWQMVPLDLPATRWAAVLEVGVLGTLYTILFGLAAWFLPGLTVADKDQLIRFVPMGRRIAGLFGIKPLAKADWRSGAPEEPSQK